MKLILKENVEFLGQTGDIVKVAPGYGRNYLLPRGLAILATEKNAKALEHAKRQLTYKKNKELESARLLSGKLEALNIELKQQSGEEGKLFGSVTNIDIANFIKENGFEIDRKRIVLAEPIKQLGDYEVPVKIHPEVTATLKVKVTASE